MSNNFPFNNIFCDRYGITVVRQYREHFKSMLLAILPSKFQDATELAIVVVIEVAWENRVKLICLSKYHLINLSLV